MPQVMQLTAGTATDLPRPPINNEFLLIEAVDAYLYSVLFFVPGQLGLPLLPAVFTRQVKVPGVPQPRYNFPAGRGQFS